jgi:hypothetical protein
MLTITALFWISLVVLVTLLIINLLKGTKEWFRGNEGSNGVIIQEPVQEFLNVSDVQQLPVKSFEVLKSERSPVQEFLNVSDVQQQPVKPSEVLKPENPERTNSIGIRKMDIRTLPNTDY